MYDNLNPTHTHTAHTTNNECQKVIEMKEQGIYRLHTVQI